MKENIIEIMHIKHIKKYKKEDQKQYNFIRRKLIKKKPACYKCGKVGHYKNNRRVKN